MPDAVKAARYGRGWREEGVAHPDGERRVFLPEGLAGGDAAAIANADFPADEELHGAGNERRERDAAVDCQPEVAVYDDTRGHGDGQRERHRPKVEHEVGHGGHFPYKARQELPHQLSREERQDKRGEHLGQYQQKRRNETAARLGVDNRYDEREAHCHGDVDHDEIGSYTRRVAAQLRGHYGRGRGCGADEAEHGSLHDDAPAALRHEQHGSGCGGEAEQLRGEQHAVPAAQAQVAHRYLAEGEKEHQEEQRGLHDGDCRLCVRAHAIEERAGGKREIRQHTHHDGNCQRPVFQKPNELLHCHPKKSALNSM